MSGQRALIVQADARAIPLPDASVLVLDPFGGAGTTGLVAARLGRRAICLDPKPEYTHDARERCDGA